MNTSRAAMMGAVVVFALSASAEKNTAQSQAANKPSEKPSQVIPANLAESDDPIIGYVEKRGRTITIKSGPKGILYSVKNSSGKMLCENVSAAQLQAQAPELHEFIKTAVAGQAVKGEGKIDASLRTKESGFR